MTAPDPGIFGVRLAGVPLLLPPDESIEYLASAPVYPLPRAGARVLGLVQLRGHPLVVLDPRERVQTASSKLRRLAVLAIGAPPDAAALVLDCAPEPVRLRERLPALDTPSCAFSAALIDAVGDASQPGLAWWRFDVRRLFESLAGG